MKIVCEKCGAKYQIPEEKVQGRVFKFNCKNCDEVIQVDNSSSSMGTGMDDSADWYIVVDDEQVGPITASQIGEYIAAGRFTSAGYVWKEGLPDWVPLQDVEELAYLNIQSLGASSVYYDEEGDAEADAYAPPGYGADPYQDQGGAYQSSYQEPESYQAAESFQGAQQESYQEPAYQDSFSSSNAFQSADAGSFAAGSFQQSSFTDSSGSPDESGTFNSAEPSLGNFASTSSSTESTGGLFAAFDNPTSGNFASSSAPAGLVGQRNESSVLFSLSSLQQVSSQTQQKEAQKGSVTEGSGLIDLAALASAHSALGGGDDAADDPFSSSTMALPPLAPMGSHKSNTPLIVGASVGVILLLGLLGLVIYLLVAKGPEPQPVAQQAAPTEKVIIREVVRENPEDKEAADEAAQAAAAAKAAAKQNEEAAKAADEAAKEDEEAADEEDDDKSGSKRGSKSRRGSSRSRSNSGSSRGNDRDDDDDDSKKSRSRGSSSGSSRSNKKDAIGALLDKMDKNDKAGSSNSRSNGGGGGGGNTSLTKEQVGGTIKRYVPRVISCGKSSNRQHLSGTMKIKFNIRPNGSVVGASVITPKFQNTDVGNCAVRVVGGMRFPSTSASSNTPVTYPFSI